MSTQIQRRRGTTSEHSTFTGAAGEITIDSTKNTVVVHDGSTQAGFPLAKESDVPSNIQDLDNVYSAMSPTDGQVLTFDTTNGWQAETLPTINTLNDISNVTITSIASGELLKWDGAAWINNTPAEAGLLTTSDIGATVQGYDANLPTWPASVDATEVGYLDGVTSSIQTQIDAKAGTGKAIAMAIVFG